MDRQAGWINQIKKTGQRTRQTKYTKQDRLYDFHSPGLETGQVKEVKLKQNNSYKKGAKRL